MTTPILSATRRDTKAGELARLRAAGRLPTTITQVSQRTLVQIPAEVDHHAFLYCWQHRAFASPFHITGLDADPLTCAITAFRYCPVSHEVIHVIAVAYAPIQRVDIPLRCPDVPGIDLPATIPVVCRGHAPTAIMVTPADKAAYATVADCAAPAGTYLLAFGQDVLTGTAISTSLPTYQRRPGR